MMSRLALLMFGACAAHAADIVVAGDSWGSLGRRAFTDMLARQGSNATVENIAIGGTTSAQWAGQYTARLTQAVAKSDVKTVWLAIGGNDAAFNLPVCALSGGSSEKCIDDVVGNVEPHVEAILATVKAANPKARVVAFGYDILGLGRDNGICSALPLGLLPGCKGDATCFNTYFLRIQAAIDEVAARNGDVLDSVNLVGSVQAGAGFDGVTLGHPDLSQYSPASLMQSNCIHPNDKGFAFVFDNLWSLYLSKFH